MYDITIDEFPPDRLAAIVHWRNDPAVNCYLRQGIRTLEEVQEWYAQYFSQAENRLLACMLLKHSSGTARSNILIRSIETAKTASSLATPTIGTKEWEPRRSHILPLSIHQVSPASSVCRYSRGQYRVRRCLEKWASNMRADGGMPGMLTGRLSTFITMRC